MSTLPCGCEVTRACEEHAKSSNAFKSKHTPGPWEVFAASRERENPGIEGDSGTYSVVMFGGPGEGIQGRTRDERDANAKLIAAAPELLTLLAKAKEMAEFGDINADMEDDGIGWKQWYRDTCAAIAKVQP